MLAINGGDGTVQAVLTEIHNGGHFGDAAPPVAVLPSGKTNLIALDLARRAIRSRRSSGCSKSPAPTSRRISSRGS